MPENQYTGRKLRKNHSNALPRYIVSIGIADTERSVDATGNKIGHTFLGGYALTARLVGTNPKAIKLHTLEKYDDLWSVVERFTALNYTTWLVSYDCVFELVLCGIAEQYEQGKQVTDWPRSKRSRENNNECNAHCFALRIIDNPPTIIASKVGTTQGRLVCVDLKNWLSIEYSKLEKFTLDSSIQRISKTKGMYFNYPSALDKCECVFRAFVELIQWQRSNDLGMFRYTAASQSMAAFRHRFMKHEILIHDNDEIKSLERKSYFGGRTTTFHVGRIKQTVYQYDVNSLFPSVMRYCYFPRKLCRFNLVANVSDPIPILSWQHSIATVLITDGRSKFPARSDNCVVFPTGTFQTTLAGQELESAYNLGVIGAVGSWAEYDCEPIFTTFIDELWSLRSGFKKDGNLLYDQLTKRLLNSLYGKFGQRQAKWQPTKESACTEPWSRWSERNNITGEVSHYRSFGWEVEKQTDRGEIEGTFVAISSFITAAARMRMNVLRDLAGEENVLYQGIDSLLVTQQGRDNLNRFGQLSDTEIGKLKLEWTCDSGEIYGKCDYRLGNKIVVSGLAQRHELDQLGMVLQRKYDADRSLFNGRSTREVIDEIVPWNRQSADQRGCTLPSDVTVAPVSTTSVERSISGVSD